MKTAILRFILNLKRPSRAKNLRLLKQRGETISSFTIREATAADTHNLATLHVQTWNDTYWYVKSKPTFETRHWQWNNWFNTEDKNWFCLVIEDKDARLV